MCKSRNKKINLPLLPDYGSFYKIGIHTKKPECIRLFYYFINIFYNFASVIVLTSPVVSVKVITIVLHSKLVTVPASPSNIILFPLKFQLPESLPDGLQTEPASWKTTVPLSLKMIRSSFTQASRLENISISWLPVLALYFIAVVL